MKSFVVSAILLSCLVATCLGAAVEPLDVAAEEVVEVELTTAINTECHQPKEIGRCFAIFKRFAFNAETHLCEEFIYGGCAGNTNNFETKEECEAKCLQKMVAAETEVELEAELETEAPVVEEKPEVVVEEKPEVILEEKPEIVLKEKPEIKAL